MTDQNAQNGQNTQTGQLAEQIKAASGNAPISTASVQAPASADEAYAVQAQVAAHIGKTAGWKVGRKSPEAAPTCAPLFEARTYASGASLPADAFRLWRMETEIAFRIAADLPARQTPYSRTEIVAVIGAMLPVFEIVDSRFAEWPDVAPLLGVADLMAHGAMVLGEAIPFDPDFDFLGAQVTLQLGDEAPEAGTGNPAGDIVELVGWLAANRGLNAGELVTTGSYTGLPPLPAGQTAIGTIAGVGTVSVTREAE